MKMRNEDLIGFVDFIMNEEVTPKLSRMRSRFVKIAKERIQQNDEDRMEIIKQYCEVDEQGELVTVTDEEGNARYKIENMDEFNKEFSELMSEYFIVEDNETNKEMLECVKAIVHNTTKMLKGQEALQYDRWCDIVEGLVE